MSNAFLGMIIEVPFNFAPRGWAFCNGQLLSIAQNNALFALFGTTYGGDGQNTFALPDLRGRRPIHPGQSPGTSSYVLGQAGGSELRTLALSQLPIHAHNADLSASSSFKAKDVTATQQAPSAGGVLARGGNGSMSGAMPRIYLPAGTTADLALAGLSVTGTTNIAGGSQPFEAIDPYVGINHIVALEGIFPSRN